jgi:Rieske Fe-S protein
VGLGLDPSLRDSGDRAAPQGRSPLLALAEIKVTLPDALPAGEAFVPPGRSVALFKEGAEVWAVSTICTHLGCIVKSSATGFDCPCHGSGFAKDGSVTRGPAPTALKWVKVSAAGGDVIVDEGESVPPGTKVSV